MEKADTSYILKQAKDHNIKFIRLWFSDILGFLKSFAITVEELEGALEEGMGFDGTAGARLPGARRGIGTLPASLWDAVQVTAQSELVRRALGDHVFENFIKNKKIEWDNYRVEVCQFELKRYLPIL